MIWVFDSGFWWLQTVKYLRAQFPYEDFLFLADTKNLPYGDKDEKTLQLLTRKNIERLLHAWCHHVVIACNTAVASIYHHWFAEDIEKKLVAVTQSAVKEIILYNFNQSAVFCTQATHTLWVYPTIYEKLGGKWVIYSIPTPEFVPLIESDTIDYESIAKYIDFYSEQITPETDCLILWCTHYPIILEMFWEKLPRLKIIDPWRSAIFTLDKRLVDKQLKKNDWKWTTRICCTGDVEKFARWAQRLLKTNDLPKITYVNF